MNKKILILREPHTKITAYAEYLHIKNITRSYVISFIHIERIYLSKSIDTSLSTCYELSIKVPLFIIDQHGYILAELKRVQDA